MKTPRSWGRGTDDLISDFLSWIGSHDGMKPGRPMGGEGIALTTLLIRPIAPFLECTSEGWARFELEWPNHREFWLDSNGEWATADAVELVSLDPRTLFEMLSLELEKTAHKILGKHCPDSHKEDMDHLSAVYNRLGLLNGAMAFLREREHSQFDDNFWLRVTGQLNDYDRTIGSKNWPAWWSLLDPLWLLLQKLDVELVLVDVPVANAKIILRAQQKRGTILNDRGAFAIGPGNTTTTNASLFFGKLATILRQEAMDKQKRESNSLSGSQLDAIYKAVTLSHVYHAISLPPPA